MGIISEKLFKTLSHRVEKEIKESLYINEVFLNSRWNFLEKSIVQWSKYYKKYIFLAVFLSCLVFANLIVWQPWLKPFAIEYLPHWKSLIQWQQGFLAGQLTIVGVVYPLVVGLIGVLFQNKSAKKILFPIYQKYSGFMFAGLSGLTLAAYIILGYFLKAYLDESTYIAICVTTALWLISNILLTAWFFVKTFRMLDERSRDRLILRFSIHESCEIDIRERIKQIFIQDAVKHGLLINPNEEVMNVITYKYSDNDYDEVTRIASRDKSIKDVRYGLINIAVWLQIAILKLSKVHGATIIIQPQRNSRNGKEMVVARYNGFKINILVRLLIKSAFSFKPRDMNNRVGLTAIINSLIGPANDALRENNTKDFSDAVKNIADWHREFSKFCVIG